MPFKTRKQKIAASKHFSFNQAGEVKYENPKTIIKKAPQGENIKTTQIENYGYVKKDLLKIVLMASLITLSQISLRVFLK